MSDRDKTARRTLAEQQRRDDAAGILWLLLRQRRAMRECTRRQRGILHDAAWNSYATACRQITLVKEAINDAR